MANRDQTWFYLALLITLLIHLSFINPFSAWLSQYKIPVLSDESIEIDLSEISPQLKKKPVKQTTLKIPPIVPPAAKKEEKRELLPLPLPLPLPKDTKPYLFKNLPKLKKRLSANIREELKKNTTFPTKPPPLAEVPAKTAAPKLESKPKPKLEKTRIKEEGVPVPSPLFLKQQKKTEKPVKPQDIVPEEVRKTFRGTKPEVTNDDKLQYSMNTYKWTFELYMENWAIDLQKWWKPPLDYAYGKVPDGGNIWIQVNLEKSGRLLGYRIMDSQVTAEMELRVIQALIGSLKRPPMPVQFPEKTLVVNWRFIYPPIRPELNLRR